MDGWLHLQDIFNIFCAQCCPMPIFTKESTNRNWTGNEGHLIKSAYPTPQIKLRSCRSKLYPTISTFQANNKVLQPWFRSKKSVRVVKLNKGAKHRNFIQKRMKTNGTKLKVTRNECSEHRQMSLEWAYLKMHSYFGGNCWIMLNNDRKRKTEWRTVSTGRMQVMRKRDRFISVARVMLGYNNSSGTWDGFGPSKRWLDEFVSRDWWRNLLQTRYAREKII